MTRLTKCELADDPACSITLMMCC